MNTVYIYWTSTALQVLLNIQGDTIMAEDIFDLEDKRRLELGLVIRERIAVELTKDGKLPADTSSREFLLRAIEGMDGVILKKAKIKTEDKLQEAQGQISNNIAELLRRVSNVKADATVLDKPFLDNDIQVDNTVPGETIIGVNSEIVKTEFFKG